MQTPESNNGSANGIAEKELSKAEARRLHRQLRRDQDGSNRGTFKRTFFGLMLIGLGSFFMAVQWGYLDTDLISLHFKWWHLALLILAGSGISEILDANNLRQFSKGMFTTGLAFWLYACMEHLWGWRFSNAWPVLVIAMGLNVLLRGLSRQPE